jgi:hypothetical protein
LQALENAYRQARLLATEPDRITLRGLVFHGHHGVLKEVRHQLPSYQPPRHSGQLD